MFEYIALKNYKSFGNVTVDFCDRYKKPKKLILIFGENGIGKSNLASAFYFLSETLHTMDVRDLLQVLLEKAPEDMAKENFTRLFKQRYKDMETLISESKMVDSQEPMSLEFGFRINGHKGRYILETNNSELIHERLDYTLTRNRGTYFDITPDKIVISPKIFLSTKAQRDLHESCQKFWGKHSFLAIFLHEAHDKSKRYIQEQITDNFDKVLTFLTRTSCKVKVGSHQEHGFIGLPEELSYSLGKGKIPAKKEYLLNHFEIMLSAFFCKTFRDVKKVYYKKTQKEDNILYRLILVKKIAGRERDLDFSFESTGSQALMQLLPYMLITVAGSTVIIDEFDTGIHDILVKNMVTSLYNGITDGQVIMTTHNTNLMEADIPKDAIYVINELSDGNKEVKTITYYDNKIHPNTNIRNQYMLGTYSGIPNEISIDFHKLWDMI